MNLKTFGKDALGVLAGGSTTPQYNYSQSGKLQVTEQPLSTGAMFRNMFAGMLVGLAGGIDTNRAGSPGGLAALAGGARADMNRLTEQDQLKRQQALTSFKATQQAQQTALKNKEVDIDEGEYKLRVAQDRRAQQQFLQSSVKSKKQLELLNLEIQSGKVALSAQSRKNLMQASEDYIHSLNAWDTFTAQGFKPIINKEFDTFAEANEAMKQNPSLAGSDSLPLLDPLTNKIAVMRGPQQAKTYDLPVLGQKGTVKQVMRPLEFAKYMQDYRVAQSRLNANNAESERARLSFKELNAKISKDANIQKARKDLDAVNGDFTKLAPSDKIALAGAVAGFAHSSAQDLSTYLKDNPEAISYDKDGRPTMDRMATLLSQNAQRWAGALNELSGAQRHEQVSGVSPLGQALTAVQRLLKQGKSKADVLQMVKESGWPDDVQQQVIRQLQLGGAQQPSLRDLLTRIGQTDLFMPPPVTQVTPKNGH